MNATDIYANFNRTDKYHFSIFRLSLRFLKSCHLTHLYLQVLISCLGMFLNLGHWMSFFHSGKMKRFCDLLFSIVLFISGTYLLEKQTNGFFYLIFNS